MSLNPLIRICAILLGTLCITQADERPNILIIYVDDLGYNDLGCFSFPADPALQAELPSPYPEKSAYAAPNQAIERVDQKRVSLTPNLDHLASQGLRLTNYHAPASVCSPSRAGLLTGSLPARLGISGPITKKFTHGLASREITIAETLKGVGYATRGYGKWHLGHGEQFQPTRHGFDQFHPSEGKDALGLERITRELIGFMTDNRNEPFFAYFAPHQPHHPMIAHPSFVGSSDQVLGKRSYMKGDGTTKTQTSSSPFHDVIHELDFRVGQILKALDEHQLADNTLVVFTSDNGPWHGQRAAREGAPGIIGSAYPYRGGKFDFWEGGTRVPAIVRFPARIPEGVVSSDPISGLDWFKTFSHLAGAPVPEDRILDGENLWPYLSGFPEKPSPRSLQTFTRKGEVRTVSTGRYKLINDQLVDSQTDFTESHDLSKKLPEVLDEITKQLKTAQAHLDREIRGHGEASSQSLVIEGSEDSSFELNATQVTTLEVSLKNLPRSEVVVNIHRRTGSEHIVPSPTRLTFTPANWQTAQPIRLARSRDAGSKAHRTVFELRGPKALPIREIFIHAPANGH